MKTIIKKLNNYRLTSIIAAGVSLLSAIYALVSLFLYHFAGEVNARGFRKVGFSSMGKTGQYLGLVFFFAVVFALILSIFVIVKVLPAIINKEKIVPQKTIFLVGAIGAVFQLIVVVLSLVLVLAETPKTAVGIWVMLPFGLIAAVATGFMLLPYLKCNFYMPEIKK